MGNVANWVARLLAGLMIGGLLQACATPRGPSKEALARAAEQRTLIAHAYQVGGPLATQQQTLTLDGPEGSLQVSLLAPAAPGHYPLVVYLPGLADQVTGGTPWRKAWAEAGYAVLSLLDRQDGVPLLASERARAGDVSGMAREAITQARRAQRVRALLFVLAQAHQFAQANKALYASIDFSRVVLAGFDTGAATALAFSGEASHPALPQAIPGLQAIIAVSPALPEDFDVRREYSHVRLPILIASSKADFDTYGLVTDLASRTAAFFAMPKPDKFLLVLQQGSHRELAGEEAMPRDIRGDEMTAHKRAGGNPPGGGRGEGGPGGGMPGGQGHGGPQRHDERAGPGGDGPGRIGDNSALQAIIRSTSLAFLQTYVKQDEVAADWLSLDAPRWLRPFGSLTVK